MLYLRHKFLKTRLNTGKKIIQQYCYNALMSHNIDVCHVFRLPFTPDMSTVNPRDP